MYISEWSEFEKNTSSESVFLIIDLLRKSRSSYVWYSTFDNNMMVFDLDIKIIFLN
jgi:hypothetical protein